MHKTLSFLAAVCSVLTLVAQGVAQPAANNGLNLVPLPKSVAVGSKRMPLGERIIPESPALQPLAEILSKEIEKLTGKKMVVEKEAAAAGDIMLRLAPP